jgi:hypothetical protein
MNSFWRYSRDKCDQQVLEWLGGGLVVAATGLWLAFVDFFPRHDLGRRTWLTTELRSPLPVAAR